MTKGQPLKCFMVLRFASVEGLFARPPDFRNPKSGLHSPQINGPRLPVIQWFRSPSRTRVFTFCEVGGLLTSLPQYLNSRVSWDQIYGSHFPLINGYDPFANLDFARLLTLCTSKGLKFVHLPLDPTTVDPRAQISRSRSDLPLRVLLSVWARDLTAGSFPL
jgi:hypothetical protein